MYKIKSTQGTYPPPTSRINWNGLIFFIIINLIGIIGTPLYIIFHGVSTSEWILFISYFFLTSLAITVGYHRLFSHLTFKTVPFVQFLLLFFGAATFEQSGLKWSSQHRQHHQYIDTDKDPYSIKKGFWYAHVGWILFWKHRVNYDNVLDLRQSKLVMHQHHNYGIWSIASGMVVPMIIGFLIGHPLGAFIMTVCLRLVLVMNTAFFINSFAHTYGDRPYDSSISARDHWIGAFLTNGEGYHNFHHKFPTDYRSGIRWFHFDPSKWIIYTLSKFNLAWNLKKTPDITLAAAKAEVLAGR